MGAPRTGRLVAAPHTSAFLDLLRGAAALAVVVGHWRNLFFRDGGDGPLSLPARALYLVTGFGHDAVLIFLVLSGLMVAPAALAPRGDWSWSQYLQRRLVRLVIVLFPALVLGYLCDHAGMALFGDAQIYGGDKLGGNVLAWDVSGRSGWLTYLGNAFFLQSFVVPPAGSNGPLWSLSCEFWYYLLFPCLWLALAAGVTLRRRLIHATLAVAMIALAPRWALNYFLVWLTGASVAAVLLRGHGPARASTGRSVLGLGFFLAVLAYGRYAAVPSVTFLPVSGFNIDELVGVGAGILCYCLFAPPDPILRLPSAIFGRFCAIVAGCSYSAYMVHMPLLVFFRAWLVHDRRWEPSGVSLLWGLGVLAVTLAYCYGFSRLTEARTDALRGWVEARFSRRPQVPQASEAPQQQRRVG